MDADSVEWEIEYHNGTILREGRDRIADLDRAAIRTVRLAAGDELVWEMDAPPNEDDFVYRRRTHTTGFQKRVEWLIGWEPGPFFLVQADGTVLDIDLTDPVNSQHDYQAREHEGEDVSAWEERRAQLT